MPTPRIVARMVKPSRSGNMRSSVTTSYSPAMTLAMPSRPVRATSTEKPLEVRVRTMSSAISSSSSIVSILGMVRDCPGSCPSSHHPQRDWLVRGAILAYREVDEAAHLHRQIVAAGVEDRHMPRATVDLELFEH